MAPQNYFVCTLGEANNISGKFNSVNHLLEEQSRNIPALPAIGFYRPHEPHSVDELYLCKVLSFQDVHHGVLVTAAILSKQLNLPANSTVGLLSASSPDFLFTWLALIRLGHSVLLIAPECSAAGIAHLCQTCEASVLIADKKNQQLGRIATRTSESSSGITLHYSPFEGTDVFEAIKQAPSVKFSFQTVNDSEIAYFHHTSGTSSGKPKPIPQTHRGAVRVLPVLEGQDAATFTTTPLYHGGPADIFRAWTSNAMTWLFPSNHVAIVPTNIVRCLKSSREEADKGLSPRIKYFASVPYILQTMAQDESSLSQLRHMDMVSVGGASLAKEIGDKLVDNKVNLVSRFGSAECGFLLSSDRNYDTDQEWQYLRAPLESPHIKFEQHEDGLYELIVLKGWPHLAKTNREDGSFATADLFEKHSLLSNAWRYHSRSDSQLTLITGKKFDPAPLEDAIVAASSALSEALIFGNNKPYPGILVFRAQSAKTMSDENLLEKLLPVVDRLNEGNQKHAWINHNMIVPMPYDLQPLTKSSKGTIQRGKAEERYAIQIDRAYIGLGNDYEDEVSDKGLPRAVRDIILNSLSKKFDYIDNDVDLFSLGVDSVAGIQIRQNMQRLLGNKQKSLPLTIVDDCGSISELANYIKKIRHGEANESITRPDDSYDEMRNLFSKYAKFEQHILTSREHLSRSDTVHNKKTVLLTGTTGLLGSHVLDLLGKDSLIEQIFCLVRGTDSSEARSRVNQSLKDRMLPELANTSSTVVLCGNANEEKLGLDSQTYHEVSELVTTVIHLAWPVNFRMKLRSFDESLQGVRNLIEFCLSSPKNNCPEFIYGSSVASAMAYENSIIPEEIMNHPSSATALGYSQSKWVAEQICSRAAHDTRLQGRITIIRIGQLSGNSTTGVWNMKEAWPTMLSSVKLTGALPDIADQSLDWLPVDIAASAVVETTNTSRKGELQILHLLNNKSSTTWSDLLTWLHKKTTFETVSPPAWIKRMDEVAGSHGSHPSLKLLELWRGAYQDTTSSKTNPKIFDTKQTSDSLISINRIKAVDEMYFDKLWTWIVSTG